MADERRLIEVNALMEKIRLMANRTSLGEISPSNISGIEVCGLILDAPTVDAVEVVRCKDCRESEMHTDFSKKKYLGCTLDPDVIYEVDPDHFCAYGEKR